MEDEIYSVSAFEALYAWGDGDLEEFDRIILEELEDPWEIFRIPRYRRLPTGLWERVVFKTYPRVEVDPGELWVIREKIYREIPKLPKDLKIKIIEFIPLGHNKYIK